MGTARRPALPPRRPPGAARYPSAGPGAEPGPRWRGARAMTEVRQTRFKDVCGSIDELKRVLYEEPQRAVAERAALDSLVEDALVMLARMELRLEQYESFRSTVLALGAAMQQIGGSRC